MRVQCLYLACTFEQFETTPVPSGHFPAILNNFFKYSHACAYNGARVRCSYFACILERFGTCVMPSELVFCVLSYFAEIGHACSAHWCALWSALRKRNLQINKLRNIVMETNKYGSARKHKADETRSVRFANSLVHLPCACSQSCT